MFAARLNAVVRSQVVPVTVDNRVLTYATCSPYSPETDRDLGFASGRRTAAMAATCSAVVTALDRCYPKPSDLDALGQRLRAGLENAKLPGKPGESAAIEMCTQIIARAVALGASEVELSCTGTNATLRYLIKPFEAPVLLGRVNAVFSRLKMRAA